MRPSTFSIVAFDPTSGEIGVAVQSKFLAVGSVVPWASSTAGAIATQAWANASFGPACLSMLEAGGSAESVLAELTRLDEGRDHRQVGIVDLHGGSATYTGASCIPSTGGIAVPNIAAQGNCLASEAVVPAMIEGYRAAGGVFADRLIAALEAAQRAGGDKRGQQSASLVICKPGGGYGGFNDRYVDLRVDDHPSPIAELARILALHKLYTFPAREHEVLTVDDELGRELVHELIRVKRLPAGHVRYDEPAALALVAFMHTENLENRLRDDGRIDVQTLDYLRTFEVDRLRGATSLRAAQNDHS